MSNDKDFKVKNGIQPTVYQEGLGTIATGSVTIGGDLANASYDNIQFDVSARETSPSGVEFKPDGTKMYIVGTAGDDITEYTLSPAWDITSATYVTDYPVSGQQVNPRCVRFKSDGTAMYVSNSSNASITTYTLSTPWSISSVTSNSTTTLSGGASSIEFWFKSDGTRIFGLSNTSVFSYTLSTPWLVSSASADTGTLTVPSGHSIALLSDGTKLYTSQETGSAGIIHEFVMTTPYDLSTGSASGVTFDASAQDIRPYGITLKPDDTKLFIVGNNDDVSQYNIGSTLTTNTLDLSTGSAFQITPTSDIQVGLSNPAASGTVSQATLLLEAEDPTGASSAFSTTLYTGTGSTQTITNGLDLAGDGGLVWTKSRNGAYNNMLFDSERGGYWLGTNLTSASTSISPNWTLNSNGYTLSTVDANWNNASYNYVSWAFKKQDSFFDIVTYTGNNTARTISHDLGCDVGMIMIKCTETTDDWVVYHRKLDATNPEDYRITLNGNFSRESGLQRWNSTPPTSTEFSLGTEDQVNDTGKTFIAYVFAHDTSATSAIKCGSYTGNGSSTGPEIDLGFEPQWLLIKKSTGSFQSWAMYDTKRGIVSGGDDALLFADTNSDEIGNYASLSVTSTGFKLDATNDWVNTSGETYIYMAIANPSATTVTYDSSIQFGGGTAPDSPAIGETDVLTFSTRDGGTTYQAAQAIDGAV
jgi:hypothetical protein